MIRASLNDELLRVLEANNAERLMSVALAEAKECVNIFVAEGVDDDALNGDEAEQDERRGAGGQASSEEPGRSRLGGFPDLPEGVKWPRAEGDASDSAARYAHFLCQLNFAEIPKVDGLSLPSRGYLWMFLRDWRDTEAMISTIYESSGASKLRRSEAPASSEWAAFATHELEMDRPMTTNSELLRFEVGLSLPFGKRSFVRAFDQIPRAYNALRKQFGASTRQGRLGGHAYSDEGHNHRLHAELAQRGMRDRLAPHIYETSADLDRAIPNLPDWLATDREYVEKLRTDLEALRPSVAWVEAHANELNEWQPFLCLHENSLIDLDWGGDGVSLWTFIRSTDLSRGHLENIIGETLP